VFVGEKHWEGCGGLELTDEMRVTIAGMACVMILGRDHDLFDGVDSILVYPTTVVRADPPLYVYERPGRVISTAQALLGEAHHRGPVVLAWDAVLEGTRDPHDGRNVVIHELAHKIDFLDGAGDGAPPLPDGAAARAWAAAMQAAYDAQRERAERGEPSLLRDYAITDPAEYFAVATEVFFERPHDLARELPDVYAQLAGFFRLDLAARSKP
jgi:Mlc titration factor MtfA (ptsG expression regulator)